MALDFTNAKNNLVTKEALTHAIGIINETYLKKTEKPGFKISKLETPEAGMASSYKLVTDEGADVTGSAVINIAKDLMLQDVDLLSCTTADQPLTGYVVGDKYFDFMVHTAATVAEGDEPKHLYVKVNELVDAYKSGNAAIAIDESTNKVSLVVDTANANGLEIGANGLKMNLATAAVGDTPAAAGAMSGADKTKLDGIEEGANNYTHPAATAAAAAFVKVGNDDKGHVVLGDNIVKKDITDIVGACSETENDVGLLTAAEKTKIAGAVQNSDITAVTKADVNTMFTTLGVTIPTGYEAT